MRLFWRHRPADEYPLMRASVPGSEQLRAGGRPPNLPPGLRIYAIGDIHGRLDLLDKLLAQIDEDLARLPATKVLYVFLGDYIDRGSCSRQTIDKLIEHGATRESIFLKGNHELIALNCLSDRSNMDRWLRLGGMETLTSYGVPAELFPNGKQTPATQAAFHDALPAAHFRFFRDLKDSFACGDYFFAHAGARPKIELTKQKEKDLLWIRNDFLASTHDFGKIIVHGHTPTHDIEVRPNRINIDTGAYATGRLTCLVIEGTSLALLDTAGR